MSDLHLAQVQIDAGRLHVWAAGCGLPKNDIGYIVHCLMCDAYGDLRPKPFAVHEKRGHYSVLGYTGHTAEALRAMRAETAEPMVANCFLAEASKQMPSNWQVGRRYAFELRACPTRQGHDPEKVSNGATTTRWEDDAMRFAEPGSDRDKVYETWLQERLRAAASLEAFSLTGFRVLKASRRGLASPSAPRRSMKSVSLPDAMFQGVLKVENSEAFAHLLASGIGRHKAFAFGALLLRPPGN